MRCQDRKNRGSSAQVKRHAVREKRKRRRREQMEQNRKIRLRVTEELRCEKRET